MKLTKETLDSIRNLKGFPIGKDEDIINLSNSPYYTACPSPFINNFLKENGKRYDEKNDDYNIEPYTADVSEGKNDEIYRAHSYHTKVPHKAIMRYILHYTKPGDIVYDGFCGTGMTGVAAQFCENPDYEYKLKVEQEFQGENKDINWGARKAILNDLSPVATFITNNYNLPVDANLFRNEAEVIFDELEKECGWMFETTHTINGIPQTDISGKLMKGKVCYTIWSDVFICPNCNNDLVFWESAVNKEDGKVNKSFKCSHCGVDLDKAGVEKQFVSFFDKDLNRIVRQVKQVPVWINYSFGNKRYEKAPDECDLELIKKIDELDIPYWYPVNRMPEGDEARRNDKLGITNVHHFYTKRGLYVAAKFIDSCNYYENRNYLKFCLTGACISITKMYRYTPNYEGGGPLSGTLYVPSVFREINPMDALMRFIIKLTSIFNNLRGKVGDVIIQTCDGSNIPINDNSIDYIFTDPPFGSNIMYSELNFLWESWLKVFTNNTKEAIVNKTQNKGLNEYQELIEKCFSENYRILKPGRWMTVEFHNTQNSVWNAIQESILKAGFVVANVKTLDKKQGSFKQITSTSAVKQDLIISAYKPKDSFVERFLNEAGTEEGVWDFVREHLAKLPVIVESNGMLEIIPERQNYLLYDSMVAFHIQKGATIPLGAADFYIGLKQRFPERDGMYFLPGQVSIYDSKRLIQELNEQLSLLILDEKTAIQWLHKELVTPQSYQDIQPKFLQELKQLKYEAMPELRDLLEENFLQDGHGKWYVPDVNKQSDLEKLRDKKLLREFDEYRNSKGKLKVFRTEAIRAGFKHCWKEKDYKTIVNIGERMPEAVVQEDPSILMYYDNALTRIGN